MANVAGAPGGGGHLGSSAFATQAMYSSLHGSALPSLTAAASDASRCCSKRRRTSGENFGEDRGGGGRSGSTASSGAADQGSDQGSKGCCQHSNVSCSYAPYAEK